MRSTCIIIEDEPLAAERLKQYVAKIETLELIGAFESPLLAFDLIKAGKTDLLFLDINLKELNGLDFLESIKHPPKVIVTTAYDEYALKGYELDVVDYLLKPFSFERFLKAVLKFREESQKHSAPKKFVFIKTENRHEKVLLEDILYIKGMGDYRQIICKQKKVMTLQTFSELERLLSSSEVLRVHKSYMVALNAIQSIKNDRIELQDKVIPVSSTYKSNLSAILDLKN